MATHRRNPPEPQPRQPYVYVPPPTAQLPPQGPPFAPPPHQSFTQPPSFEQLRSFEQQQSRSFDRQPFPEQRSIPQPVPQQPVLQQAWPVPPAEKRPSRVKHLVLYPVVALVMFGAGVAAGGGGGDGTVTAAPQSASSPTASAPAAQPAARPATPKAAPASGLGNPVRDGKFEFSVTKVKPGVKSVGDQYLGKKAQGQFVLVDVTVENIGKKPQSLFGENQKLFDAEGREFSADSEAAIYLDDARPLFDEINPGNTVEGTLVFDIPKGASPQRLELHDSAFSGGVGLTL